MATSGNALTSTDCWLKPHRNLQEGEKTDNPRANCQHLAWLPLNATRRPPALGPPDGSGYVPWLRPPRSSVLARA